jgi:single-stranded-DNA-specific exonuclease
MNQVINEILTSRGYASKEEQNEFFSTDLNDLPDLTLMKDMSKTSKRIIKAINNKESIGIYGDYDVDGTTSCALFYQFFKMMKIEVKLIQPSRFIDGYGVHNSSIDNAVSQGIQLLITVDCGITNHETALYAKDKLDLIITDHHHGKETNPEAFSIVNPNREDEKDSKLKAIYPLLQYVAIGTISDMATLNPMNIKLVRHGLKQLPTTKYHGLRSFFSDKALKNGIKSEDISFQVGPMINAIGRLDHPDLALQLLITDSHVKAMRMFTKLHQSNTERKAIQKKVQREAQNQINRNLLRGNASCNIVYSNDWHEGVIGIAASQLVQNYKKPTLVFTDSEETGIIKASCRSVGQFDLFSELKKCSDLFIKFGGHPAAAGLSMKKENLPKLRKKLNRLLKDVDFQQIYKDNENLYSVKAKDVSLSLAHNLRTLEPFGMGNPNPMFSLEDFVIKGYTVLKEVHVKWHFQSKTDPNVIFDGISFNFIDKNGALLPEEYVKMQETKDLKSKVRLSINEFRGKRKIQALVEDIF